MTRYTFNDYSAEAGVEIVEDSRRIVKDVMKGDFEKYPEIAWNLVGKTIESLTQLFIKWFDHDTILKNNKN